MYPDLNRQVYVFNSPVAFNDDGWRKEFAPRKQKLREGSEYEVIGSP